MTLSKPLLLGGATLLIAMAPAFAQKIAPSHNYNAYDETPRQQPSKTYGLPTFGTPESQLPQQKTMATTQPRAPGPSIGTRGSGNTDLGPPNSDSGTGPSAAPETGAPAATGLGEADQPNLDFFPKTQSETLPLPTSSAARKMGSGMDGMDTPLFTTPDGAPSSDTTSASDTASGGTEE